MSSVKVSNQTSSQALLQFSPPTMCLTCNTKRKQRGHWSFFKGKSSAHIDYWSIFLFSFCSIFFFFSFQLFRNVKMSLTVFRALNQWLSEFYVDFIISTFPFETNFSLLCVLMHLLSFINYIFFFTVQYS